MLIRCASWSLPILVCLLLSGNPSSAQDLALTRDCEVGFQRIIQSAQNGELGDDVTNANVGVSPHRVEIELVRRNGSNKVLLLTRRTSTQALSRYFDIELGEHATASDAARVGRVLDQAFQEDPFEVAFDFFGALAMSDFPTLTEAWQYGGWTRVLRVAEGRLAAPVGLRSTVAVIVLVATALLASLVLLSRSG